METFLMVRLSPVRGLVCVSYAHGGDAMQSETLKYLYLLFEDDSVLPLSSTLSLALLFSVVFQITDMNRAEYVFNTEVGFSAP